MQRPLNAETYNNGSEWSARIIRTFDFYDDIATVSLTTILSKPELDRYFINRAQKIQLSEYPFVVTADSEAFIDAFDQYTDHFFAEKYLAIVSLAETSGSIRHRIDGIDDKSTIFLTRLTAEVFTQDMAQWYIIIELNRCYNPEQLNLVINTE